MEKLQERVSSSSKPPVRDCHGLFAARETVRCAFQGCIPCAYKVATFDVALDTAFGIPNQRPETCPRGAVSVAKPALGFSSGMRVLTVGDGDLTYSLALARMECHVTATSYESKETLTKVYKRVSATLDELFQCASCSVAFEVDGTKLHTNPLLHDQRFERIVWNFPCSAIGEGQDGQNQEMEGNKDLIRQFVQAALPLLEANGGQIHMNHKTKPPFNQWKIESVVVAASNSMHYLGRIVLDRHLLPPYVPRKALHGKSFSCHDACTYIFETTASKRTMADILPIASSWDNDKDTTSVLVAVTPKLIRSLRTKLLLDQKKRGPTTKTAKRKKRRY